MGSCILQGRHRADEDAEGPEPDIARILTRSNHCTFQRRHRLLDTRLTSRAKRGPKANIHIMDTVLEHLERRFVPHTHTREPWMV